MKEVRYEMLRPAEIIERRKDCPAAYIPLGNLEWHGIHNPLGADTLQASDFVDMVAMAREQVDKILKETPKYSCQEGLCREIDRLYELEIAKRTS